MRSLIIFTFVTILAFPVFAKKKGAPPMAAGANGDRTCAASKCHASYDLNSGDAKIFIEGLPEKYTANEVYEITLQLEQKRGKLWGFQATVADEEGMRVGKIISMEGQNTQLLPEEKYKSRTNRQYITHTVSGIRGSEKEKSPAWKIQWQAPDTSLVSPSFYFAFNVGNGNKKKTGDHVYTRVVTIAPDTE
ncbi:MAG: hypothetical protein K9M49_00595 [Candidatus Marinimicrobia bacterium]|nr:hypothetical protein [Candidatus Neomarinimicrobiota bacterium]MCF7850640.1 hypothetical protein [Candidatus Neomarinimicrobiota bacterium]MCF7903626.1 hypothetical protein [Candidatus Neomarinimicrobiota bacterium]